MSYIDENIKIEKIKTNKNQSKERVYSKEEVELMGINNKNIISKDDYILTLITYLSEPYAVIPSKNEIKGKCLICGVETNSIERKICPVCLREYKNKLYAGYKSGEIQF